MQAKTFTKKHSHCFSFSTGFLFSKKKKCVDVYGYDPLLSKEEIESFGVNALDDMLQITDNILPPAGRPIADRMDCVIAAVAHDEFKKMELKDLTRMMNDKPVLIDIRGMFKGEEAKKKGFYYKTL